VAYFIKESALGEDCQTHRETFIHALLFAGEPSGTTGVIAARVLLIR
jgi:hypothetical protein